MIDKPIPVTEEFEDQLFEQRVLIFIEGEPQSNRYHQVLLDEARFLKVLDLIGTPAICEHGNEIVEINESDEDYLLPDLHSFEEKKLST